MTTTTSTTTGTTTYETLPEGGVTTVKSGKYGPYNQTKREAETRWVLNPEQAGVPQVVVDLSTHHDPDSKVFRTSLTWGTVESKALHPNDGDGTYSVYSWASDHTSVVLGREPVARYSVKALEAEHQRVLTLLTEHFVEAYGDRVFNEAAERNGLGAEEE